MKNKLSFKLTKSIVGIVLIIMLVNLITIYGFLRADGRHNISNKIALYNDDIDESNPFTFGRGFRGYVVVEEDNIYIKETGRRLLDEKGCWFQLLDEDGNEVYAYKTHDKIVKKYTPFEMTLRYEFPMADILFVDRMIVDDYEYSYVIGYPETDIGRWIINYRVDHIGRMVIFFTILSIILCIIIATTVGFYYSQKIALPMQNTINRIELLSDNIYHYEYNDDPFYSNIDKNLNILSLNLQQAEKEREELEKLKSDWISNISHDIKTPLASIRGYSEIMKDYELSEEEIKKYGDILNEKSLYIEELLGELRLSNRLKDKEVALNLEKTNMIEFSRGLIVEILNSEDNSVSIDFHSNREKIYKDIDQFMFKRVFENLVYNSIYYSKEDIQIDVTIEETEKNIMMKFRDNGIGIKEEDLKNIFSRYYRGSNTTKKGTGLGLAITKDVVERHGGTIEVDSVLNEFTEFTINFKK